MRGSIRNYFRLLAEDRERGFAARLLGPLLSGIAWVYGVGVGTLRLLHEKKILKRKRLPYPVVSVGNLTWGGSGKTPLVEYLAHRISERRRTPLVLTRGYSQDEIEQLRHHLPRVIIGVGKDRLKVGRNIGQRNRIDIAVLDDGLQHWPVERDIEIVAVNCLNPFGNGHLLPRGILREPLSVLKNAAIIVLSHVNLVKIEDLKKLKEQIQRIAPNSFIVESYLEPLFFYRARQRSRVSLDRLHNHRVTTFSGVASPRSFQLTLSNFQIKPIRNFEFTDHHPFSVQELEEIKRVSDSAFAAEIITTEKDFYRSPKAISEILNPLILATRLRILSGEDVLTDRLFRLVGLVK
ncbi:MAG: tetraacyldisaccharide 4'-kinase [Candidatus Omnitrophota bacterium]|nr:tetraacyldisaccharide 4'-kinase [Candidatus Omnitrophota bacterium]